MGQVRVRQERGGAGEEVEAGRGGAGVDRGGEGWGRRGLTCACDSMNSVATQHVAWVGWGRGTDVHLPSMTEMTKMNMRIDTAHEM